MSGAGFRAALAFIAIALFGGILGALALGIVGAILGTVIDAAASTDGWGTRLGGWLSYCGPVLSVIVGARVARDIVYSERPSGSSSSGSGPRAASQSHLPVPSTRTGPSRPSAAPSSARRPGDEAHNVRRGTARQEALDRRVPAPSAAERAQEAQERARWQRRRDELARENRERSADLARRWSGTADPSADPELPARGPWLGPRPDLSAAPDDVDAPAPGGGSRTTLYPDEDLPAVPASALPYQGRVGGYQLLRPIGAGGMGAVYQGVDAGGEMVALKLMNPGLSHDPALRTRFDREARALRALPRSPRLAEFLDAGVHEMTPYLVMDYIAAPSLRSARRLRPDQVSAVAHQLAEALEILHGRGLTHRDIKPDNVMWAPRRGVCLVDFGIARSEGETPLTATGGIIGTPGYIAPEIFSGAEATAASDVWSWAAVLCWATAGRGLFGAGSALQVIARSTSYDIDRDVVAATKVLGPARHQLIAAAVARAPADRPTASAIVRSWG